ncbi:MAG: heavy metal-associated domain-containing protein [Rubrivivax sp.]|nr:heavy metal-associated domain-containing protein [Rubrivivax sp.]
MLSVLSVEGVEERIGQVPGVESVTVNFAAGNATVRFDETRLDVADIKSDVRQRGSDTTAQAKAPTPDTHEGHAAPGADKADAAKAPAPETPLPPAAAAPKDNASSANNRVDKPDKTP